MPVAPSFENYKRITTEPFQKNGKLYVTVEHPNTRNLRDVRWYSDTEFAKAYGKKLSANIDKSSFTNLKATRGFEYGPLVVIRRNLVTDEEWLRQSSARYAVGIGWHFVSQDVFTPNATLPENIPEHFRFVLLGWDEFRDGDDFHMKSPEVLADIISEKIKRKEFINL